MNEIDIQNFSIAVAELSAAIAAFGEIAGMQAENTRRAFAGHSPAYAEDAFLDVLRIRGLREPQG